MSFDARMASVARRQKRLNRAHWWFERMRQVVDRAMDWRPAPPPRPEQMWFHDSGPQSGMAQEPSATDSSCERQICE